MFCELVLAYLEYLDLRKLENFFFVAPSPALQKTDSMDSQDLGMPQVNQVEDESMETDSRQEEVHKSQGICISKEF